MGGVLDRRRGREVMRSVTLPSPNIFEGQQFAVTEDTSTRTKPFNDLIAPFDSSLLSDIIWSKRVCFNFTTSVTFSLTICISANERLMYVNNLKNMSAF